VLAVGAVVIGAVAVASCGTVRITGSREPYDFDNVVLNERDAARGGHVRRPAGMASQRTPQGARVASAERRKTASNPGPVAPARKSVQPEPRRSEPVVYPSDSARMRAQLAGAQVGREPPTRKDFVAMILETAQEAVAVDPNDRYPRALRRALADRGVMHLTGLPKPGDLVFFDHTHDWNGNGKADDDASLCGIVERVEGDTIVFVAAHAGKVRRLAVTPTRPHTQRDEAHALPLNTRLVAWQSGGPALAGECWAGWASLSP
jgi:hypothetical protein